MIREDARAVCEATGVVPTFLGCRTKDIPLTDKGTNDRIRSLIKDFDPKVGLTIVILGATVSAVFYYFGRDLTAYGVLAVAVLVDLAVYRRLGDVTICYRCHAEFRGRFERMAEGFDLHTADVLEAEYAKQVGR